MVDPMTGNSRYELPYPLAGDVYFSADGRWLAGEGDNESIEVWDADPFPRWPWALLAGMIAFGGVILAGKVKWRRGTSSNVGLETGAIC